MKRLCACLLIALGLTLTAACSAFAPPGPSALVISPPSPSPSASPAPSIVLPDGPARTHMFGLPWTLVSQIRPLSDGLRYNDQWRGLCYEGLFELDAALNPQPLLCRSASTEDNRTYVLTLRDDVRFHDGAELTASDVVFSFQEALREGSPYRARFDGLGLSARETDPLTVEVALTRPLARFEALLDFPVVRGGRDRADIDAGTGPYRACIDESGDAYLIGFDGWWRGLALPVRRIELVDISGPDELAYKFQNGAVSMAVLDPHDPASPQLHSGMEVWGMPTTDMVYLGFNTALKPLDDAQTRKAITMALDRAALTKAAYGSYALPTALPAPPASEPGSLPVDTPAYDFGAAAVLLEELGYTDEDYDDVLEYKASRYLRRPFEIDLLVNAENPARAELARQCAEQLELLGIRVNVRAVGWEGYLSSLESGAYGMYIGEVRLSAELSAEQFVSKGGRLNYPDYRDPELDELLSRLDEAPAYARKAAYRDVYAHIAENAPIMVLCFREQLLGTQRGLAQDPTPLGWNALYGFSGWRIG